MIKQVELTEPGLAKIQAAKKAGLWHKDPRPQISLDIPPDRRLILKDRKFGNSQMAATIGNQGQLL